MPGAGRMAARFSPELGLLIACCRWPRSPGRDEAVRLAAASVSDWELFERLAIRHRVVPLVQDGVTRAGIALPQALHRRLGAGAAQCVMAGLAQAHESVRLQQAFLAARLPVLVIKGAPLAILAYGDVGLKDSWDIDLLTSPEALPQARTAMEALGYELSFPTGLTPAQFDRFERYAIEAIYVHQELELVVELHWRVARNHRLLPAVGARSPSQAVRVAEAELYTFDDAVLFAYLCLHGTQHGWARLKWLADLAALIAPRSPADIERLYRSAVAMGSGRTPAVALLLCRRLLGVRLSGPLLSELQRDPLARFIERCALRLIGQPDELSAVPLARLTLYGAQLFLAPGAATVRAQLGLLWDRPLERARFGGPAFAIAFHLLRIPLWLARMAHRSAGRRHPSFGSDRRPRFPAARRRASAAPETTVN